MIEEELKEEIKKFEEAILTINATDNDIVYTKHDLHRYIRAVMADLIKLPDTLIAQYEPATEVEA